MKLKFLAALLLSLSTLTAHADSWSYGQIDIVESFSNSIRIRWDGPNTEGCNQNTVDLTAGSLGNEETLKRAYTLALVSIASGKPIRMHLQGCSGHVQNGTAAQLCGSLDCSY